ncbi:MAG: UDP-glucose/GDP-mannose dehydrogenase family protein [Acidobacteria bacterium]|nr:UDP-glucose/GDP-mannose dehydrogenase family protein [Acidobacteriota bacterium]
MRVCVVGTGYVGLVTGACLAEKGHQVTCVDVDPAKVEQLNRAEPPIHERGLAELLKSNVGTRLCGTTDLAGAVRESDLSFIAVGTPFDGREIDVAQVRSAAEAIGAALREHHGYHTVVVKSTVVPGTTEELVLPILEETSGKKAGRDFGVGMNPEFLREGEAVSDFLHPDRIVLGGIDERTVQAMGQLYDVFEGVDVIRTSPKTAETIKYASNALFATMISFSNEIGNLCAALGGLDVTEVMRGVHLDHRLSPILPGTGRIVPAFTSYLEAGCGFGGSCFPKDVKSLIAHGRAAGLPMELLDAVIRINERQPREVVRRIQKHFPSLAGVRIALLGLAFKPGTDDMRESPALPVAQELLAQGALLKAYDPVARREAEKLLSSRDVEYVDDLWSSIDGVDAIVLMTRWPEFEALPRLLADRNPQPLVVDGRRMLDKREIERYEGIGL